MRHGKDPARESKKMGSHIIDSVVYGAGFAPPEMAEIFSDRNRVQKWFDVEAALAQAQAELGMIPAEAAAEITRKARVELVDLAAIGAGVSQVAHSLVPALRALARLCAGGAGEYIHYGTTTQDIIDTGMMLQLKEAWTLIVQELRHIRQLLADQARQHKGTVMVGRTHGQQALPITWGYKLAVWVDEIDRHLERCTEGEKRIFVGNITGAVGTMAAFGELGLEVQRRTLQRLGLGVPRICWHSARDRITELATLLTQMAGTMGKIANEIYNLQRTEIAELREPFHMGKVGSSTMPHKQNPSTVELVVVLARLVRGNLMPLTDTLFQEHERDASCWRIEWAALPEACLYTGAILTHMRKVLAGLQIWEEQMTRNLHLLGGLLLSERVMLALGEKIGKQTAHELVYEIAMRAYEEKIPFRQALASDPRITTHLDPERLDHLLDPTTYIGLAPLLVEQVVGSDDPVST
ncbi:MAG: adenylosuccinate lyase [Nitrospinota bacterium]|nr:MAG: adenylosuccinate lyase [Nitrospinota bacterium]